MGGALLDWYCVRLRPVVPLELRRSLSGARAIHMIQRVRVRVELYAWTGQSWYHLAAFGEEPRGFSFNREEEWDMKKLLAVLIALTFAAGSAFAQEKKGDAKKDEMKKDAKKDGAKKEAAKKGEAKKEAAKKGAAKKGEMKKDEKK